jgi:hypothetical protein
MEQADHGKQARQFTRDDMARMVIITLDQVLDEVHVQQIVEALAVLPTGKGVYLVDIVMRDLTTGRKWGILVSIPPRKEEAVNEVLAEKKEQETP